MSDSSSPPDGAYPAPMLTVDVVAFANGPELPHTNQPQPPHTNWPAPYVLLIQRGRPPFAGAWALPGGFVEESEQVTEAAARELREETGIHAGALELLGVYDTPGRDPRGWTVSVVYLTRLGSRRSVKAADDAREARWFTLDTLPQLAFDHDLILSDAIARLHQ